MMSQYDLIALDMDGTLLNDRKEIGEESKAAIRQAISAGKEVVLCTGRALAETARFLDDFPGMRYVLCESGALLYDLREGRPLFRTVIRQEDLKKIHEAAGDRDIMPVAFSSGKYYANRSQVYRLADYQMPLYAAESPKIATAVDDLWDEILCGRLELEKLNLFHQSPEDRQETYDQILRFSEETPMEEEFTFAEISSLEISPKGVHKGAALAQLAKLTGIQAERMIMVGDADNDLTALQFAGLAVAMGNANEHVRSVSKEIVADNNHDGCAEAIRRFLL